MRDSIVPVTSPARATGGKRGGGSIRCSFWGYGLAKIKMLKNYFIWVYYKFQMTSSCIVGHITDHRPVTCHGSPQKQFAHPPPSYCQFIYLRTPLHGGPLRSSPSVVYASQSLSWDLTKCAPAGERAVGESRRSAWENPTNCVLSAALRLPPWSLIPPVTNFGGWNLFLYSVVLSFYPSKLMHSFFLSHKLHVVIPQERGTGAHWTKQPKSKEERSYTRGREIRMQTK